LVLLAALVTTVLTQGLVLGGQGPLGRGLLRLFRPSQLEASLLWVSAMIVVKFPHTFPAERFNYTQFMTGGAFMRVMPRVASRHVFLPPEVQQECQRPDKIAPPIERVIINCDTQTMCKLCTYCCCVNLSYQFSCILKQAEQLFCAHSCSFPDADFYGFIHIKMYGASCVKTKIKSS